MESPAPLAPCVDPDDPVREGYRFILIVILIPVAISVLCYLQGRFNPLLQGKATCCSWTVAMWTHLGKGNVTAAAMSTKATLEEVGLEANEWVIEQKKQYTTTKDFKTQLLITFLLGLSTFCFLLWLLYAGSPSLGSFVCDDALLAVSVLAAMTAKYLTERSILSAFKEQNEVQKKLLTDQLNQISALKDASELWKRHGDEALDVFQQQLRGMQEENARHEANNKSQRWVALTQMYLTLKAEYPETLDAEALKMIQNEYGTILGGRTMCKIEERFQESGEKLALKDVRAIASAQLEELDKERLGELKLLGYARKEKEVIMILDKSMEEVRASSPDVSTSGPSSRAGGALELV